MKASTLATTAIAASALLAACSSNSPPQQMGTSSGAGAASGAGAGTGAIAGTGAGGGGGSLTTSGAASGTTSASGSGTTSASGTPSSGTMSASGTPSSGTMSASGTPSSGTTAGSGATATTGISSGSSGMSSSGLAADASLPAGAVHDVPADYKGMPFMGMMGQIPGTIFARNYDTGGEGVGFHHPGGTTCSDWPGGMAMYRTGADCVGLSVENSQKPDVTVDGGPADYGEIYVSYTATGEWLNFTVEVLESGTYAISMNEGGPNNSVSFSFSATPAVTTGTIMVPQSVDQAQPGHEMFHVWQNVNDIGMITLQAGVYVMQFTIVAGIANFDSFTFTKM